MMIETVHTSWIEFLIHIMLTLIVSWCSSSSCQWWEARNLAWNWVASLILLSLFTSLLAFSTLRPLLLRPFSMTAVFSGSANKNATCSNIKYRVSQKKIIIIYWITSFRNTLYVFNHWQKQYYSLMIVVDTLITFLFVLLISEVVGDSVVLSGHILDGWLPDGPGSLTIGVEAAVSDVSSSTPPASRI